LLGQPILDHPSLFHRSVYVAGFILTPRRTACDVGRDFALGFDDRSAGVCRDREDEMAPRRGAVYRLETTPSYGRIATTA
jgi:hypothetical protein